MLFTPQVSGSHTSKSNRILALGDSFFDITCHSYRNPAARNIKFWPEIIAKELNMDIDIHGFSGCSNEHIFNKLLDYTNEKDYDLIIVNWTQLWRLTFEDYTKPGPISPAGKRRDSHTTSANFLCRGQLERIKRSEHKPINKLKNLSADENIIADKQWLTDVYQILYYESNHFTWENVRARNQRLIDIVKKLFPNSIQVWGTEPIDYSVMIEFNLKEEKIKFDIHNKKNIKFRVAQWCHLQDDEDKYFCAPDDGHPNTFANEKIAELMMPKVKEVIK